MSTARIIIAHGAANISRPEIAAFAFDGASAICLAGLVIALKSSDKFKATVHPVLINFLVTLLLYSSGKTVSGLARFSFSKNALYYRCSTNNFFDFSDRTSKCDSVNYALDNISTFMLLRFQVIFSEVLWSITQVANLNIFIHTWYTLRSSNLTVLVSWQAQKRRELLLLITPYLSGLLPMIDLIPLVFYLTDAGLDAILSTLTAVWNITILVMIIRLRPKFQDYLTSPRFLIAMLGFTIFKFALTILNLIAAFNGGAPIIAIVVVGRSVFPFLVSIFFSLDILQVFFPGLSRDSSRTSLEILGERSPAAVGENTPPITLSPVTTSDMEVN